MQIFFSNSALEDLKAIKAYYLELEVPHIGPEKTSEIISRIESLLDNPSLGRAVPEFNEPHIREIIHPPYRIVYLRNVESIQIIRVWRSERLLTLPSVYSEGLS